jgi:hypothetical protein
MLWSTTGERLLTHLGRTQVFRSRSNACLASTPITLRWAAPGVGLVTARKHPSQRAAVPGWMQWPRPTVGAYRGSTLVTGQRVCELTWRARAGTSSSSSA